MVYLLETYDDIGDFDICRILPRGSCTIITTNRNNVVSKIEDFCKKTNKTIIIMVPYKPETIYDYANYIITVTKTIDSGILFSRRKTEIVEEFQRMAEHRNKRIMWINEF